MSRDTSIRSSGDRVDASLILWWVEFFALIVVAVSGTVDVLFLDLAFVGPIPTIMAWVYLFGHIRESIKDSPCKHPVTPQRTKLHITSVGVNMSRTVSFRASEKLDEFLEQEAERRLVTKSTVAQMLVAERYRQLQDEREDESQVPEVDETDAEEDDLSSGDSKEERPEFERYPEKWYVPDSSKGYEYAVRMAAGGRVKYYKTAEGAANRLEKEYGE